MLEEIIKKFGLTGSPVIIEPFGNGLINRTWKVTMADGDYILQRVNGHVFKSPDDIAHNTKLIADYLAYHHPGYLFVSPVLSIDGSPIVREENGSAFRMFPFVSGSHASDVVTAPQEAFQAASQFGRFTRLLNGLQVNKLKITIPFFHHLPSRFEQLVHALENGNQRRAVEAASLVKRMINLSGIVDAYRKIIADKHFSQRVTHHDTKISNVLFDSSGNALCVIDLDTVMPGYFFSDLGDMMRTYLSPTDEEESDFSKIEIRDEFYRAVVDGYSGEMQDVLSASERACFYHSGLFMIYMQAIRYLTDYLLNDKYYGEKYPGHNLIRAGNQATLLQRLMEKKQVLDRMGK